MELGKVSEVAIRRPGFPHGTPRIDVKQTNKNNNSFDLNTDYKK